MVNVGVLGYGVVGSGVVEVLRKNKCSIKARAGEEIIVKRILDIRDFPESPDKEILTKQPEDIFNDDSIDIVVETIGGTKIAYDFTKKALQMGKHVVTSNKELVATHGPELLKLASDKNVKYLFEASVGGGIPIIRPLNQCLAANEISGIAGILNGTTNYILTKMTNEGMDFNSALKAAQQNGYAEADPTADVDGHDACRKIAILSSIAYNEFVDYKNIHTEGIRGIGIDDIRYAKAMNSVIKLIALSRKYGNRIFARVCPAIVSKDHPLASVNDVFNAIVVNGDAIGEAMFYGRGAGKLPTASAVVADIIDIVKNAGAKPINVWKVSENNAMIDVLESDMRFFIRVKAKKLDEAQKAIADIFGSTNWIRISGESISDEIGFVSEKKLEKQLMHEVEKLRNIKCIKNIENIIRIFDEESIL